MAQTMELNIHLSGTSEKDRVHEKLDTTINGGTNSSQNDKNIKASDTVNKGINYAQVATAAWAIGQTKSLVNSSVKYLGSTYGDPALANSVSNALSAAGSVLGIVSATATGAAAGGVIGAVVGAVLAIGSEAIQVARSAFDYSNSLAENLKTTQRESERLGIISTNGNR